MENKEIWSFNKRDLFTIPNILTYIRFFLIVPFAYYFLCDDYIPAVICIGISGLTDCFDDTVHKFLYFIGDVGNYLYC